MAKITSGLLKTGKIAKKGNSLVRRTNAFIGRKIGRKGRTIAKQFGNLNKTTARGKSGNYTLCCMKRATSYSGKTRRPTKKHFLCPNTRGIR